MNEKINLSVKEAVKTSRRIKRDSKSQNVNLRGSTSNNLEDIQGRAEREVRELLEENKDWVDKQLKNVLSDFPDLDREGIIKTFMEGLMIFFKQQYRLFTKDQKSFPKEIPEKLKDSQYIHEQIIAYTFDFVQSLKYSVDFVHLSKDSNGNGNGNSHGKGLSSAQALELAKLSYSHDPSILKDLKKKYPSVRQGVINRAAISSSNPEKFIEDYLARVQELFIEYTKLGVDRGVIRYAALRFPPNSRKFIDDYIVRVNELTRKYPNVDLWTIKYAALYHPNEIEEFIKTHRHGHKPIDPSMLGDQE